MALLVLAYPELEPADYARIETYRKAHDELWYGIVEPHFTLVFAVIDMPQNTFIDEVSAQAAFVSAIDFEIRCATINKDAFKDYFHAFLVPDKGHSQLIRLHDRLYSGILRDHLRLDIDYIPHISVGNSEYKFQTKKMVDEWNATDFCMKGRIQKLHVVQFENNVVTTLKEITLA